MFINSKEPITFDKAFRILLGLSLIVLTFFIINYLSSVLVPFFVAIIFAYILNPLVGFFQFKLKMKKRWLAVFSMLIFLGLIVFGAIKLLGPSISSEIHEATTIIQNYSSEKMENYDDSQIAIFISESVDKIAENDELMSQIKTQDFVAIAKKLLENLGGVYNSSMKLLSGISGLFLGVLYFLFALLQYDNFFGKWDEIIPRKHQSLVRLVFTDVKNAMSNYFRSQFVIAMIVGVLFAIGFKIIGLPLAIILGLGIGLLNMIPYLQIIGLLPATLLAFIHSLESQQEFYIILLFVLLVFTIVQVVQDAFLVPRIMGKATGLNAVIILLGLSIWGKLLGMIGLLLAIPLTFLLLSYYKRLFVKPLEEKTETQP